MLRILKKPKAIPVTIDPTDLSHPLHQELLAQLNENTQNRVLESCPPGEGGSPYKVKLNDQNYEIYLTYDVVPRENNKREKSTLTYQIVSDMPFAVGSQGSIHKNKGKYKIEDGKAQTKPHNPSKPRKKTLTKREDVQGDPKEIHARYQKRANIFKRVKHLETKPFKFFLSYVEDGGGEVEGYVYTVSTKFKGINLYELIEKLATESLFLKPHQLLQLAKNIVQAFDDQVVKCNVVHKDIKTKNIVVDPTTLAVNFVDYDLAKCAEEKDEGFTGTLGYIPKEVFQGADTSVNSDLYALGVVLYELLGGVIDESFDFPSISEETTSEERKKIQRDHLEKVIEKKLDLNQLGQFSYLEQEEGAYLVERMKPLIEKLLSDDPAERPLPDAILRQLNEIEISATEEADAAPSIERPVRVPGLKLFDKGKEKGPAKEEKPARQYRHSSFN